MKKLTALLLLPIFALAAFAQAKKTAAAWEYLDVSVVETACGYLSDVCRHYYYFETGQTLAGPVALDWLEKAGWEPVGVRRKADTPDGLLFRRIFNAERAEKERAALADLLGREYRAGSVDLLVDLDRRDGQREAIEFNDAERRRLRAALEAVRDLPLEIVTVTVDSDNRKKTRAGAEIVVDATKDLLKGNNYRSSAAETYFKAAADKILDRIGAAPVERIDGNAVAISGGGFRAAIGNFTVRSDGLTLKLSVVVDYKGSRIIVAQGWIYTDWRRIRDKFAPNGAKISLGG